MVLAADYGSMRTNEMFAWFVANVIDERRPMLPLARATPACRACSRPADDALVCHALARYGGRL